MLSRETQFTSLDHALETITITISDTLHKLQGHLIQVLRILNYYQPFLVENTQLPAIRFIGHLFGSK